MLIFHPHTSMHHSKMPSAHQGQFKFIIAFWYHPWKLLDQIFRYADYLQPKESWHWLESFFSPLIPFHLHCFSIWRLRFLGWTTYTYLPVSCRTQAHRIPLLCQVRCTKCRSRSASSTSVIAHILQSSAFAFRALGQLLLLYTCCIS